MSPVLMNSKVKNYTQLFKCYDFLGLKKKKKGKKVSNSTKISQFIIKGLK